MPRMMFYNPANPKQQYWTISAADANIPAGWVDSQGSDGAQPEAQQVYRAGVNNQGAGAIGYLATADGDPPMRTVQPNWPNGILNGYGGGGATAVSVVKQVGQPALYGLFKYAQRHWGGY